MRTRSNATISDLRVAIDCMPRSTREAMLKGINENDIIVGAYTDGDGVCPMLAAHRNGGRTDFISFAKAWDRFAFRGKRLRVARRATDRELLVLRTHLEASLFEEAAPAPDLAAAVAEHQQLMARRAETATNERRRRVRPAAPRTPAASPRGEELRELESRSWLMRIFRRQEDYTAALERLLAEEQALSAQPEREREYV
jgi:hypothetical protein